MLGRGERQAMAACRAHTAGVARAIGGSGVLRWQRAGIKLCVIVRIDTVMSRMHLLVHHGMAVMGGRVRLRMGSLALCRPAVKHRRRSPPLQGNGGHQEPDQEQAKARHERAILLACAPARSGGAKDP